jgi:hypothetical protein
MTMFPIDDAFFAGRSPGSYNDPEFRAIEAKCVRTPDRG